MQTEDVAISVQDLGKVYHLYSCPQDRLRQVFVRGRKQLYREFWALRQTSFALRRGEVVGVIGRNGSGKSTLLQILAGVLRPSTGRVELHGRVAALLELGSGFNPEFTGRENIYLNGAILGLNGEQIEQRYESITRFADIGQFIDQPVKTYSSGMHVRLAFAVAAHVDADLLIIDEALSVGDAAFQFKCMHHLEQLLEKGATVVLVSHNMQLIKGYCNSALYLRQGTLAYQGDCETAAEMYSAELVSQQRAYLQNQAPSRALTAPAASSPPGQEGRILQVSIGCDEGAQDCFLCGSRPWVQVLARVSPGVRRPRLQMVVRDLNGYNLFSYGNLDAEKPLRPDGQGLIGGRFSFDCALKTGDYSIAVRLDDYMADNIVVQLDKRVNAALFKVLAKETHFGGAVNLNGSFEPAGSHLALATDPAR